MAKARIRRAEARTLVADGIDPGQAKRETKLARIAAARETFEMVARTWLDKTSALRAATTQEKATGWLERDVFPVIGQALIASLKPRDVLLCVQRIEARGALDSAHRVKQICGQVFRFAVAAGLVERDVTADLKGALSVPTKTSYASITEPKKVGVLMRSIYGYSAPLRDRSAQALCTSLRTSRRAAVRRVEGDRLRRRRVAHPRGENEDEA